MSNTSTQKPVLISGAGLASLLLAQSLLRAQIPFQIFERDSSFSFRAQGYRLRLSSEGLDAIESVLGPEKFQRFWDLCGKTGGGGFAAIDAKTGASTSLSSTESPFIQKLKDEKEKAAADETEKAQSSRPPTESLTSRGGKIVGISRGDMRRFFMEGCEAFIHWSHRVASYELNPSGVFAIFSDGTKSTEGQLLVAGDGIYSKVAKQLSEGKLKVYDTGARGIHEQAPTTAFKALGEGVWRLTDDSNPNGRVFAITNVRPGDMDDPTVQFGWTMGAQPGVIRAPNNDYTLIGAPAAAIAKNLTTDWHPTVKPLFEEMAESEAAFWKISCSTPSGVPQWQNQPRVTVLGDAVHSMTPAGGIGANTAVRDSALLGRLLSEAGGLVDGITDTYEREMRLYASEAVASSYGMARTQFGVVIDENSDTI